jgi:hypothetical protein
MKFEILEEDPASKSYASLKISRRRKKEKKKDEDYVSERYTVFTQTPRYRQVRFLMSSTP